MRTNSSYMFHSTEPQKDVFDLSGEYYRSESHKQMRQIRLHECTWKVSELSGR